MGTDDIVIDSAGVATELEWTAIEVLLGTGPDRAEDDSIGSVKELERLAVETLLAAGKNADENADASAEDNNAGDGDGETPTVDELGRPVFEDRIKLLRSKKRVENADDTDGSATVLETIETAARKLDVGLTAKGVDIAGADKVAEVKTRRIDDAMDKISEDATSLDTPKTPEIAFGVSRVLEVGIDQCVKADCMEVREELNDGCPMRDVGIV
jgi:hypothetical protein